MSIFSTHLLKARKESGYSSQEDFAKILGIPQQTYGNYESGRSFPKEETLRRIGVELGVSVDLLLGLSQPKTRTQDESSLNAKISRLKENAAEASASVEKLLSSIKKLEAAV